MVQRLSLLNASFVLLDAAIAGDERIGELLDAVVAPGWSGFPEALPSLRAAYRDGGNDDDAVVVWGTVLFLVDDPRTLVGIGGYKGRPSPDGVIEIGYAIAPAFQGRGLATAATKQLVERALADASINAVDAHTLGQANPSTRVLEKVGFQKIAELEDPDDGPIWHWRFKR